MSETGENQIELNFDGDWQGTWARQNSTANLPVASRLHRSFWMPSLHYMSADGEVVGEYYRQCYYDKNAAGNLPEAWQYHNSALDSESRWLGTMGDDILIMNPLALWSDRPLDKKGSQHYSYGISGRQTTVEVYKFSDDFLVNSRWQIEIPDYIPQADYNACASLRWQYDENTLRLTFYAFNAVIPIISNVGEESVISMIFYFENTSVLEERMYEKTDKHVAPDEPRLTSDSFGLRYGPRVTQIQLVKDVKLTVVNIGTDTVDITVRGQLPDDTAFLASGKVFITPDGWFPQ